MRRSSVCVSLVLALLVACGGDDDGDDDAGSDGAGDDGDADASTSAGPDAGAGGDGDAGVACARDILAGLDLGAPDRMIADDASLYVAAYTEEEHRLWRIRREDGEAERIATFAEIHRAASLASDADSLYFSGVVLPEATPVPPENGLFRVPKDGAGPPEPISTDTADGLAVDETHIYWLTRDSILGFAIKRRAKSGGKEELLVQGDESGLGPHMALLGEHVYWDEGIELRRVPTTGGPGELFGYLDPEGPPGSCSTCLNELVAGEDGRLYWFETTSEATLFHRTGPDVFEPELLVTDGLYSAISVPFFVFDGQLYWSSPDAGIRRAPAAGGDSVRVKDRNAPAFVPTSAGLYTVNWLDVVRLMPLEGCPE